MSAAPFLDVPPLAGGPGWAADGVAEAASPRPSDAARRARDHAADHRSGWMAAAGVTLVVYVLLAVPVRRRRAGTR